MRFQVGRTVERREVLHGQVWLSSPVTVVHDADDCLAVLVEPGAPFHFPPHPEPHPWAQHSSWSGTFVLQLRRPDDAYGVWKFFDLNQNFIGWYLNFEARPVRHVDADGGGCFDTLDHGIDIVIPPDAGGVWSWKDYDDPARLVELGRLSRAEADEVMRAAHAVADELDSGRMWWSEWTRWQPSDLARSP